MRLVQATTLSINQRSDSWVDVESSELVQPKDMDVIELDRHVASELLSVAGIPLLGVWSFEVWI